MPTQHGAFVSLCLIVRNEEGNLADCLRPVAALFDEIVIVDTGSTDRTKEIAAEFTKKIHDFAWRDDFSAARNEGLRHTTGDWIFWLDADDRVESGEAVKLATLLEGLGREDQVYSMTTVCQPEHEGDSAHHLTHCRLFRKHPRLQWKGRVHEQLRPEPVALGFTEIARPDIRIRHTGYAIAALRLKKIQRDIRLLRMDYAMQPDDMATIYHLSLAYARSGNFTDALKLAVMLEPRVGPELPWGYRVYELMMDWSTKLGDLGAAKNHAVAGLSKYPDEIPLLFSLAQTEYEMDQYDEAARLLRHILSLPERSKPPCGSVSDIRSKWTPLLLADIWRMQGRADDADSLIENALNDHPEDVRLLYTLGYCYITSGRRALLPGVCQRMESQAAGDIFSLLLVITDRMCHAEWEGLDAQIDRLIQLAPQLPRARQLRVEYLERTNATAVEYLAACRDSLRLWPNDPRVRENMEKVEKALATAAAC